MTNNETSSSRTARVSKADWLEAALVELQSGGIESVKVERLAKKIGVAKSGFYWHFKDRNDLKNQMLDYWAEEFTSSFLRTPELTLGTPVERLNNIIRVIDQHDLDRYEIAIRGWALVEDVAAEVYRRVISNRLIFVRQIFSELGFKRPELEVRTRIFVCYFSWERSIYPDVSVRKRNTINNGVLTLLTKA